MIACKPLLRASFAALLTASSAASYTGPASAQNYPTKPVRLIVPFPPGGSNDIVGRLMAEELSQRLGKQVVVDNRGGAGGVLGSEIAANSEPDGHTLLIISVAYAFNPALYQLRFDPDKAFAPIAMIGTGPNALTVNPKLPANSVKELIALAKTKPGQLNYASAGIGTFQHLGSELLVDAEIAQGLPNVEIGLARCHYPEARARAVDDDAIEAVRASVQILFDELSGGQDRAGELIGRAHAMAEALNGVTHQLNAELPAALTGVEQQAGQTRPPDPRRRCNPLR